MCSGLETCIQYLQRHNETVDYIETCSQYLQRHNDW